MVQVYQVMSYGRRFYRVLEYTSDVRSTLRDMQPSLDDRQQLWPVWERHGAGHPYQDHWGNPLSCVITRGAEFSQNLSGGLETLVPERLLYGTIPQALLEQFIFWQDESDNLLGYPKDDKSPYLIEVELIDVRKIWCSKLPGTGAQIRRVLKKDRESRLRDIIAFVGYLGATVSTTSSAVSSPKISNDEIVNSWNFGFKMLKRLDSILSFGVPIEDLKDFIDALKESGIVYEDAAILVAEVETYARENAVDVRSNTTSSELLEQSNLTLVNIAFATLNSKFHGLLKTISRLENASYILCWTLSKSLLSPSSATIQVDLIELPRLKMSFAEHNDEHGVSRLYSLDHVNLFVSNSRSELSAKLMQGLPHSLLMSTSNDELQILVPTIDPVRPKIGNSPFTTGRLSRGSFYNYLTIVV